MCSGYSRPGLLPLHLSVRPSRDIVFYGFRFLDWVQLFIIQVGGNHYSIEIKDVVK
jgi:hypothetical protein